MSSSNYKSWLTSKLVLSHLTYFIVPILVLEYRPNRSVDDAVIMALHLRLLFMDFSYAFNTILPAGLQDTISQFNSRKHVRLVWFRLSVDQHCFPSGLCTLSSAYLYTLTAAPPITTPLNSRSLQLTPRSQGSPQVGLSLEQHGAQCYQNSRDDTGLPAPSSHIPACLSSGDNQVLPLPGNNLPAPKVGPKDQLLQQEATSCTS